jgi:hypothetical protein
MSSRLSSLGLFGIPKTLFYVYFSCLDSHADSNVENCVQLCDRNVTYITLVWRELCIIAIKKHASQFWWAERKLLQRCVKMFSTHVQLHMHWGMICQMIQSKTLSITLVQGREHRGDGDTCPTPDFEAVERRGVEQDEVIRNWGVVSQFSDHVYAPGHLFRKLSTICSIYIQRLCGSRFGDIITVMKR